MKLYSNNDNTEMIDVIAFKSSNIINDKDLGYLGTIGQNTDNNRIIGESCKDKNFNHDNPSYCYFFVTFSNDLEIKLNQKKITKLSQLRLKELFGLKEEWGPYTHVVQMSVKKSNLFRPCYDKPDIKTTKCTKETLNNENNTEYNIWFENFKNNSIKNNIPFTGLGYTFDWLNPNNDYEGVTEMVILPGSQVTIKHIYNIKEFFTTLKKEFID